MTNPDANRPDDPVDVHNRWKNVENDGPHPKGTIIDTGVIHADAGPRAISSVNWIEDDKSDVSYHSLVERDGDLHRLVEPWRRAWHAGDSIYQGRKNVNNFSLGLAFANKNDGKEPYTEIQYQVGAAEMAYWMTLKELQGVFFRITMDRITTHAIIAPTRKSDPGPLFDMDKFKEYVQKHLDGVIRP